VIPQACTDVDCQLDEVTHFDPKPELDQAIAVLNEEQEIEFQLLQETLDARIDAIRFKEALGRLLQHRAEMQEAA
jgi:hypothetical protein